jgi:hypothetical protein
MELSVNGHTLSIGQLGPNFVILREAIDHPPAEAEISMSVDGHPRRWKVHLTNGIVAGSLKTTIAPIN